MPIAFHRLTEDEKSAICAEFEGGARVGEIDSAHDITPHCRKRVLTEAGFAEVSGSVPVEKRVRFGAAAPGPLAQRPPPPPPPMPQRKRARSASISSAASCSAQDFQPARLESDPPEAPLEQQAFATSPLPEYVGERAQAGEPQHDGETGDFSDGVSDEGTVCSVTPSEAAELNGAILEATAPSRAQAPDADPERDMLLLQCRMYAMEFAEVLGPQLIGQTKSARARWIKNLASYDKQALRQTLERCEMIVGGSNAHALMKGGLSMGCRAAEMVGGMVGFQLEGYHDQMVMSPAVDGLLRELRIKHIGQLSAVLSPEQRLMGVLLLGIVATDSQNRFRASHDAELRRPVASDLPERYASL